VSKEFNKELMGYIGKKRVKRGLFGLGPKPGYQKPKSEKKASEVAKGVEVEYKKPGLMSKLFSFRRGLIKDAEKTEDLSPEEMAKLRGMEDEIEETEEKIMEKEEDVKEIKQEENELVEKRENMLTKFFSKVNFLKSKRMEPDQAEPEEREDEEPVLDQDVIEVIKIGHRWLNELPPGAKRRFKSSDDFQKYKEVLEKYGLVKEKKEETEE
jgi:hypothetical protein